MRRSRPSWRADPISDPVPATSPAAGDPPAYRNLRSDTQDTDPARADAQKKPGRTGERDRADVAEPRSAWRDEQGGMNPARLMVIDETDTATNMARRYGRSPLGQRLDGPSRMGRRTTIFAALIPAAASTLPVSSRAPQSGSSFRPSAVARPMYLRDRMLAPELNPGDVIASRAPVRASCMDRIDTLGHR